MQVAAKIAAISGGVAVGGAGAWAVSRVMANYRSDSIERARTVVDSKRADWEDWNAKLEREFPGRKLPDHEAHQRYNSFIASRPAPKWVDARGYFSGSLGRSQVYVHTKDGNALGRLGPTDPADDQMPVFQLFFGGAAALIGVVAAVAPQGLATSPAGRIATMAGGAALGALGLGVVGDAIVNSPERKDVPGYTELVDDVNNY